MSDAGPRHIAYKIGLAATLIVLSLAASADPPPPPAPGFPGSTTTVWGQTTTAPNITLGAGQSITEVNHWPVFVPCSSPYGGNTAGTATLTFTGSALYTGGYEEGGVYVPGAVSSTMTPGIIGLMGAGGSPVSSIHYTLSPLPLPAPAGLYLQILSYGNYTSVTCPAGYSFPSGPSEIFTVELTASGSALDYFLVAPNVAPPDLGNCSGSASQSGCAQTPEPINPASGNEALTEPDDYHSGDGRLRLTRTYNSIIAAAPSMPYSLGFGWQNNFAARQLAFANQVAGLLPQYAVSQNYTSASAACTQGWADVAPGQPGSGGVTATYSGGMCQLSNGQSWPVYSNSVGAGAPVAIAVQRPGGATYLFACTTTSCTGNPSVAISLVPGSSGFTLTDENNNVEQYNLGGILQSLTYRGGYTQNFSYSRGFLAAVTDSFGRALGFTYSASGQLQTVTTPSGQIQYGFDTAGRLASVTYPDSTNRTYAYGNPQYPYALTSVVDENGSTYASISYDSLGRATQASFAGGVWANSVNYATPSAPVITDAFGVGRTYQYTTIGGRAKLAAISGSSCNTCNNPPSIAYDGAGYYQSSTDWNGNVTHYVYNDVRGLQTSRTEAYGTADARIITTAWDPNWREPDSVTEANRTTSYTYDSMGNGLTKTITDTTVTPNVSRTWTYTYNGYGQPLTAKSPRTDLNSTTKYSYYTCTTGIQCGQVETITDALGHVWTFNTYNADGQPLTITDPNGVVTTLTYDSRQRLLSREVGTETTTSSYYPTGLMKLVTQPDGSTMLLTYDTAHRLTIVTDSLGNYIHYTLDAMGNRAAENSYDPTGALHRTHTRVFNVLNEFYQDINAAGTPAVTTTYGYDGNGNQISIDAPLSRNTGEQFDALNRLDQITDPNTGITKLGYDANDNVASVQDPRNLTTSYSHDGFGDLTQQISPDTGTTTKTYDAAGNLSTLRDARGFTGTYTYDALNRVTKMQWPDQLAQFGYDVGTNGIGHLTSETGGTHTTVWTYSAQGRVTGVGQTTTQGSTATLSIGYGYTNGDLTSMVTPSGQTVTYAYTNHQVTSISINGTTLLSGVTYDPFGPATGWAWGNSTTTSRSYTEDGVPNQIVTAGVTNGYSEDNALRITGSSDSGLASNSWTFGYDLLDRVNSGSSSASTRGYQYDANGNTTIQTGTVAYTASISPTSNQVNSISGGLPRTYSYDAAGNTTQYIGFTYQYNDRGRLSNIVQSAGTTSNIYNGLGQLIEIYGYGGTTVFVYDLAGHILGEYTVTGGLIQETIWLGDLPVATLRPNGSSIAIYYVHADHLGTPRKVTRPSDNGLMWRWDPDTFGSVAPNQNPSGLGTFVYNLRFPGQYYRVESGLFYNNSRDYDPQTGRYVESDPIGLRGWSYSTYVYVRENPISRRDSTGLADWGGLSIDPITAQGLSAQQTANYASSLLSWIVGAGGSGAIGAGPNSSSISGDASSGLYLNTGTGEYGGFTSSGGNLCPAPTGGLGYSLGGYFGFVYGTPSDGLAGPFVNDTYNIPDTNFSFTAYYSGGQFVGGTVGYGLGAGAAQTISTTQLYPSFRLH